jgi:hypothetical protein
MVKTFDPKLFSCIIGGKIMSGFADGTFIKISMNSDAFSLKVGVDGEGTRSKSNDYSGKLEITLMQSSESNDDLSAFAIADRLSNSGAVPLIVKDGSGRTVASAVTGWITKFPDTEFAKEVSTRAWTIETDNWQLLVGGN